MKFLITLFIILILSGCSPKIKNGTYLLSHAYRGEATNIMGEQDQELIVENNKIKRIIYESYLKPVDGIISDDKMIFDNGDTLKFKATKKGLNIYKRDIVYVWIYKK